jgi:hypothetical protein
VSSPANPSDESFDAASSLLSAGLRSCRAVVSNYRALLESCADEDGAQAGFSEPAEESERPSN